MTVEPARLFRHKLPFSFRSVGAFRVSSEYEYGIGLLSPDKDFQQGALIRFVCAPSRWRGEPPREPAGVQGELAVVTGGPYPDSHHWGGIFDVVLCKENKSFQYWGDFMEAVA